MIMKLLCSTNVSRVNHAAQNHPSPPGVGGRSRCEYSARRNNVRHDALHEKPMTVLLLSALSVQLDHMVCGSSFAGQPLFITCLIAIPGGDYSNRRGSSSPTGQIASSSSSSDDGRRRETLLLFRIVNGECSFTLLEVMLAAGRR